MLHLVLRLKAPLAAAGVVSGEELRRTADVPTRSMVLGLVGNAMGLDRTNRADMGRLDRLQATTRFSVLMLSVPGRWTDVQNARVPPPDIDDVSRRHTSGGRIADAPELVLGQVTRDAKKLSEFLKKPVQRRKQYLTDLHALVALSPASDGWPEDPSALRDALRTPARALWIGRKVCQPSAPVLPIQTPIEADSGPHALVRSCAEVIEQDALARGREALDLIWEEAPAPGSHVAERLGIAGGFATELADRKDWIRGVHSGTSVLWRGTLVRSVISAHA